MIYSKLTFVGGRSHNEDSVHVGHVGDMLVAVVADGLGGVGKGDVASDTAVRAVFHHFSRDQRCSAQNIAAAVEQANYAVCQAQTVQVKMKTTIVVFCLQGEQAFSAHLGDSRLYQFRGNDIRFQTQDHSVSQMAVSIGEISKDQIRSHADRNKILRALGTEDPAQPEVHELHVQAGDGLLLCSDGFWEPVWEEEMLRCFSQARDPADWLTQMEGILKPRLCARSDNYSAITIMI